MILKFGVGNMNFSNYGGPNDIVGSIVGHRSSATTYKNYEKIDEKLNGIRHKRVQYSD